MYCRYPRSDASVRIFCFPWAGGGASFFTAWGKDVTEDAEVYGYCPPGREQRFNESLNYTYKDLVDEIVKTIHEDYSDKPFIFYGHSLGANLAFFAACKLRELYGKQPDHMILSGTIAPHSPRRKDRDVKSMSNLKLSEEVQKLGGTPPEILQNKDLAELFIPLLRADLEIIPEIQYKHDPEAPPPLTCQIDFFDGEDDIDHDVASWRQVTSGAFTERKLPGGHFFLQDPENMRKLINYINLWCSGYDDIF